jgi:hypothetical protein
LPRARATTSRESLPSLGKIFTCDDNGVTAFIERLGIIPTIEYSAADRVNGAKYHDFVLVGAVLVALDQAIKRGLVKASEELAAKVASAAFGLEVVASLATAYQIAHHFECGEG